MSKLKILLVEDRILDVDALSCAIKKTYEELRKKRTIQDEEMNFSGLEIEEMPGIKDQNPQFTPYDETIVELLKGRAEEIRKAGDRAGVLADSVLNMEELDAIEENEYSKLTLAKKIMQDCEKENIPVFVVTSIGNFDTSALKIMGKPMEDQYVQKSLILEYPSRSAIYKILYYLGNGRPVSEEQLEKLF